jgi:hypothetical protein
MRFSNGSRRKPQTSSGTFLKEMPQPISLARASELEEPL